MAAPTTRAWGPCIECGSERLTPLGDEAATVAVRCETCGLVLSVEELARVREGWATIIDLDHYRPAPPGAGHRGGSWAPSLTLLLGLCAAALLGGTHAVASLLLAGVVAACVVVIVLGMRDDARALPAPRRESSADQLARMHAIAAAEDAWVTDAGWGR